MVGDETIPTCEDVFEKATSEKLTAEFQVVVHLQKPKALTVHLEIQIGYIRYFHRLSGTSLLHLDFLEQVWGHLVRINLQEASIDFDTFQSCEPSSILTEWLCFRSPFQTHSDRFGKSSIAGFLPTMISDTLHSALIAKHHPNPG